MRIIHVLNTLSDRGNGIINLAVDLAIVQHNAGHQVAILAGHGGHEALVRASGVEVFLVDQTRKPLNILKAAAKFHGIIRRFRPDVVHAHMQTGMLLALPWCRLYRIPLIAHLHNVHDKAASRMGRADCVITVSAAVAQSMREQGVPDSKLRVVLNGNLRNPRFAPLSTLTPPPLLRPSIITVAGMYQRKGIAELIEAFNIVAPQAEGNLYILGDGPDKTLFEEQARLTPASDRIHFVGFHPSPQSFMLSADIFVLASRRDSCPLVLGEAREAGCAIVASDVDGIPEALDGGEAGILVPVQSPPELAAALLLLLRDPELRKSWQQRAQANLDRFFVSRMSNDILDIYRELIGKPRSGERSAVTEQPVNTAPGLRQG
jgi:glycosyltransferase involved in cell wall biosynthesis